MTSSGSPATTSSRTTASRVKEVEGVGYLVTVAPGAAARPTFRYRISDGRSDPVSAVVVVAVTDDVAVDQPPVARADVDRGARRRQGPTSRCWTTTTTPRAASSRSSTSPRGTASTSSPGLNGQTVDVRVGAGVISSFTLSYTVVDTAGNRSSAFVDVRIVPPDEVNRPPIARTDISRTKSGVGIEIPAVANDSDPDGDIIAVESISTQPTGGVATVEAGTIVYTPNDTFAGTDRLTYALVDAGGEIAIGEVLVGVMPLAVAEPGPGGVRRHGPGDRRQRPARLRRAGQRLGPRRRPHPRHDRRHAHRRRGRGHRGRPTASCSRPPSRGGPPAPHGRRVHLRHRRRARRHRPGHRERRRSSPPASRWHPSPSTTSSARSRRVSRSRSISWPTTSTRTGTPPSSSSPVTTRRSPIATAARSRSSPGPRRPATPTPSPTRTASPTRPRSTSSSSRTGPRSCNPTPCRPRRTRRSPSTSPPRPPIRTATRSTTRAATTRRAAPPPPSRTAPAQLTVSFDPDDDFAGLASFAYTVDDQQGHSVAGAVTVDVLPPSNRPPTATDTDPHRRSRHAPDHRPRRPRHRPRPERHADVHVDRALLRRRVARRRRLDRRRHRPARGHRHHRLVPVHRHRRRPARPPRPPSRSP